VIRPRAVVDAEALPQHSHGWAGGAAPAGTTDLAVALAGAFDRGDLRVAVQPIVGLPDATLRGVEILLRWPGGPGPDVFVPVAEESGLIAPIGRWVLTQALDVAARLAGALGWQVPVSVNVSARQLRDPSFAGYVLGELTRTGLPGSALSLEVTETSGLDDPARAAEVLTELRRAGCAVGLDDFGTGWSTLSLVALLPLTFLKLDRSFVAALGTDSGTTVARAVLTMGRDLGLDVVAEGVETRRQAELLQAMGCSLAQGYLFGRPTLSLDEVVDTATCAGSRAVS
jgi:EAL domain-containing protein (putative c-di-GMP-specific phosphodiesterase class I)